MHDLNEELYLKISLLFLVLASFSPSTVIVSFTTIYASLKSHESDLNIEVLNLILFINIGHLISHLFRAIFCHKF